MWKDFDYLAKRLVPIGEQIGFSHREKAEMMKSKTRRFSAEDIGNSGRNEWQNMADMDSRWRQNYTGTCGPICISFTSHHHILIFYSMDTSLS
jgi:hypothetical protein